MPSEATEHRKLAATVFTDPFYLVNVPLTGAWEGLDRDMIPMQWHGDMAEHGSHSSKFFADRGHRQILAAYHDAGSEWTVSDDELTRLTELFCRFEGASDPLAFKCREAKAEFNSLVDTLYRTKVAPRFQSISLHQFRSYAWSLQTQAQVSNTFSSTSRTSV